jgi:ferredoxin
MTASVDREKCIGCGLCASDCPAVFAMDDDNIAIVTVQSVGAENKEACRMAAANCPVEAITLTD